MADVIPCRRLFVRGKSYCIVALGIIGCILSATAFASRFSAAPVQLSFNGFIMGQGLGWSAALSADGRVAVLGGPGSSSSIPGEAVLYTQNAGIWSEPIQLDLSGIANGVQAGWSVGVAPDGSQAFISAPDITTYTGAVYSYTPVNGSWANAMPSKLSTSGIPQYASFGSSLALSGDGQVLAVGADHAADSTNNPGVIYVYTQTNGSWGNPLPLPVPAALAGIKAGLGKSIAASADGSVIVTGAPNGATGTVYVYIQTNGSWNNGVALPIPAGASGNGTSVAISSDGQEILTGSPYAGSGAGAAYLYTFDGSQWNLVHTFTAANTGTLGWCVALSPDGTEAFFGSPSLTGAIYGSANNNGTWSAPVPLSVYNVQYGAALGWSMAMAQNGQLILSGALGANANAGDGYVYNSAANITLSITPSANPVAPGSDVTFNLTFTNADQPGTFPATTLSNVVLTDTLPSGVTYVSSNTANGTCTDSGGTVTCMLASLAPGNNSQNPWSPSITVKAPSSSGTLTNTLSVAADQPLQGTTNTSTTLTVNSSGSSSSGKSGGGALDLATLLLLGALLIFINQRKRYLVH